MHYMYYVIQILFLVTVTPRFPYSYCKYSKIIPILFLINIFDNFQNNSKTVSYSGVLNEAYSSIHTQNHFWIGLYSILVVHWIGRFTKLDSHTILTTCIRNMTTTFCSFVVVSLFGIPCVLGV